MSGESAVEEDLEAWRHEGDPGAILQLKRRTASGVEPVLVYGGRTVHLTSAERRMNQQDAASDKLDPFRNGRLTLISGDRDDAEVAALVSSPNHLTEGDLVETLKMPIADLRARVAGISNRTTLRRLLEAAEAGGTNAAKTTVVKDRLAEVDAPPPPPATTRDDD